MSDVKISEENSECLRGKSHIEFDLTYSLPNGEFLSKLPRSFESTCFTGQAKLAIKQTYHKTRSNIKSQLMRLWHFSSSVNSFFSCACTVGLDVYFLVGPFVYFHTSFERTAMAETARMRRLAWAFTGRLCDKYHNLMSWLLKSYNMDSVMQGADT